MHTEMFTAGLFIPDRHCSPIQDRLEKLQEIHVMEYLAAHRGVRPISDPTQACPTSGSLVNVTFHELVISQPLLCL